MTYCYTGEGCLTLYLGGDGFGADCYATGLGPVFWHDINSVSGDDEGGFCCHNFLLVEDGGE